MQIPDKSTPVSKCESLASFAHGALTRYAALFSPPADVAAKLAALGGTVQAAATALAKTQAEYRAAVLALVGPRVGVKLVDLKADDLVRSVKRAADDAGPAVSAAVFPNGVTPIVKAFGQTEVDELRALEGRVEAAGKWSDAAAQKARVADLRAAYEAALADRKAGMVAASDKRALRDAAKEDFLDTYAAVAGAVRELFPRDRARQDVFFDVVRASAAADEGGDEPDEPAPVA